MMYRKVRHHDRRSLRYRRPQTSFSDSSEIMRQSCGSVGGSTRFETAEELDDNPDSQKGTRKNQSSSRASLVNIRKSIRMRSESRRYRALHPRTQEVFEQAMFYMGAFYFTHVWSTTSRIIQQVHPGKTYFALGVVHSFFDPFQGALNFMVYQRPRFRRIRAHYPDMSFFQVMRRVLRFSFLPPLDDTSTMRSSRRTESNRFVGKSEIKSVRESEAFEENNECSRDAVREDAVNKYAHYEDSLKGRVIVTRNMNEEYLTSDDFVDEDFVDEDIAEEAQIGGHLVTPVAADPVDLAMIVEADDSNSGSDYIGFEAKDANNSIGTTDDVMQSGDNQVPASVPDTNITAVDGYSVASPGTEFVAMAESTGSIVSTDAASSDNDNTSPLGLKSDMMIDDPDELMNEESEERMARLQSQLQARKLMK
jgi:hypothetical protein